MTRQIFCLQEASTAAVRSAWYDVRLRLAPHWCRISRTISYAPSL